ncbi:MAG: ATP-binding protein, partial [Acidobacteria bacterium]|nr:ATP-binding protein [Acidobacteriota bacterium]
MRTDIQRFRWMTARLPDQTTHRLVVLTGARQTGKTTTARQRYAGLRYVNLDNLEEREALSTLRTAAWGATVGDAIVDEAQKAPTTFDKVKWAFDEGHIRFSVLLGSSRLLLMQRIRETLAGRAFVYDLWPLMASELRHAGDERPAWPLLHALLEGSAPFDDVLGDQPPALMASDDEGRQAASDHLAGWGGMPALLPLSDPDRREWLRSYQQTFLERDLIDLARLPDFDPFRALQHLCMLRTGNLLSYSDLARDAGLSPSTARRYVEYLKASYQVVLLPPFSENLTSTLVKAPKLYWVDLGLLRQGTRQWGPLTGALFESLVVGEIQKWVSTLGLDARLFFYRTRSGMEVDLVIDTVHGVIGVEVKSRPAAVPTDARGLVALAHA